MDFTVKKYKELLLTLQNSGYKCVSFRDYILSEKLILKQSLTINGSQDYDAGAVRKSERKAGGGAASPGTQRKRLILRHDVDRMPANSLRLARLERDIGVTGTYYFRIVPESYDLTVVDAIARLGDEIGYHYEDVDLVTKSSEVRGKELSEDNLIDLAFESFRRNVKMLREGYNVTTACMHGSPRSKYDNKIIWKKYSYMDLGIIGEPYLDIDFNKCAYFSDTGRRWNGGKVSIRDKVSSSYNFNYRTTTQLIDNVDSLPDEVMLTIHPQRWNVNFVPWSNELVAQNAKNFAKRLVNLKSR